MWIVEQEGDRRGWTAQRATLPNPPRSEDEWIDRMTEMRLDEFLRFFALAAAPRGEAMT
jgi:hypothetical protein